MRFLSCASRVPNCSVSSRAPESCVINQPDAQAKESAFFYWLAPQAHEKTWSNPRSALLLRHLRRNRCRRMLGRELLLATGQLGIGLGAGHATVTHFEHQQAR